MAYQFTILCAHWLLTRKGWVIYNSCYRRKALVTKLLGWGRADFSLYVTFTRRAKAVERCSYCSIEQHSVQLNCTLRPTCEWQVEKLQVTQQNS